MNSVGDSKETQVITFDWTKHDSGDMEIELPDGGPTARITQGEHAGPGTWTAAVFADDQEPHARPGCERHDFNSGDEAQEWAEELMVELAEEQQETMSESDLREALSEALQEYEASGEVVRSVASFSEAGVLTYNEGLVVRLEDGSEFQITIVRSR
jgi:hypothetical protein